MVLFITFCPRTRLLEDKMVNPSPGPSSEVEFEVPSLSLSFGLDCWLKKKSEGEMKNNPE